VTVGFSADNTFKTFLVCLIDLLNFHFLCIAILLKYSLNLHFSPQLSTKPDFLRHSLISEKMLFSGVCYIGEAKLQYWHSPFTCPLVHCHRPSVVKLISFLHPASSILNASKIGRLNVRLGLPLDHLNFEYFSQISPSLYAFDLA